MKPQADLILTPGKRMQALCEARGISRKELANRLDIAPSQVSRILNEDTKSISSDILIKMATEFHVSTDYILGLEQKKQMERHIPMRLMSTSFKPGECLMLVNQLEDPASREMAYCEYYYFTGQHDKAVNLTVLYLNHPDPMLRLSACLIHTFANLSLNRIKNCFTLIHGKVFS